MEPGVAQRLTFLDRNGLGYGFDASKTLSPKDLEIMQDYYNAVGATKGEQRSSQYLDLRASLEDPLRATADPAAVLVLHNFVDTVLGPGSTAAIETELQAMADENLMWQSSVATRREQPRCLENQLSDFEDKARCVVPFSTLPMCQKLRGVLCCWAQQDHPLVADNERCYHPRDKVHSMWQGRPEANIVIGACFGPLSSALPLRFHAYIQGNPVGNETTLCMNRGDVYFFSHSAIGNDDGCAKAQTNTKLTWEHVHSSKAPLLPFAPAVSAAEKRERARLEKAIRKGTKIRRERCAFLR